MRKIKPSRTRMMQLRLASRTYLINFATSLHFCFALNLFLVWNQVDVGKEGGYT